MTISSLWNFLDEASTKEIFKSFFSKLYIFSASRLSLVIIAVDLYSSCKVLISFNNDSFKSLTVFLITTGLLLSLRIAFTCFRFNILFV